MTVLFRKSPHRQRKPLPRGGTRVDWAHPSGINSGLLCWYLFNEGAGTKVYDLTGQQSPGTFTNSPTWGAAQTGIGVSFDQSAVKLITLPTFAGFNVNEGTIAISLMHTATTVLQNILLLQKDSNNNFEFYNGMGGFGVEISFGRHGNSPSSIDYASFTDETINVWKRYFLTWSVSKNLIAIYQNGVQRATATVSQTWSGGVPTTNYLGGNNSASRSLVGVIDQFRLWGRSISPAGAAKLAADPFLGLATKRYWLFRTPSAGPTAALTGTITASATETDIRAGGKTIILTLTGDTWVSAGATFDAQRQNIINGLTAASSPANGWNNVVKAGAAVTDVVRTSNTVVTITLEAFASYDITATETVTATIPATALTGGNAITASPTFTVSATTPLTAGALTLTGTTVTTASLSWTNSTGGVGSVSQQLQRKTGSGGTYADVSGATSSPKTDTGLSNDTVYYYRVRYTDSDSPASVVYSNEVLARTWLGVANTKLLVSPYCYNDGSGTLQSNFVRPNATFVRPISAGWYARTKFTVASGGAGVIRAKFNGDMLVGVPSNDTPIFKWIYGQLVGTDVGGPTSPTTSQLSNAGGTLSVTLCSGLAAGTYVLQLWLKSVSYNGVSNGVNRWIMTAPAYIADFLGFQGDDDVTFLTPPKRSKVMMVLGASHTEGVQVLGTGNGIADNDASQTADAFFARAFDCEQGNRAWAGVGVRDHGIDRVSPPTTARPSFINADPTKQIWDKYFSGQTMLVGGLFDPPPDFIKFNLGTNDFASPLQAADVTALLDALRTAAGTACKIIVTHDVAASQAAALTAGAAAAAVQTNLFRILPTQLIRSTDGFNRLEDSEFTFDAGTGLHPNLLGNAHHGAEEVYLAKAAIDAAAGGGGLLVQRGFTGGLPG